MILNDELERIMKGVFASYCSVLSQNFPGGNDKKNTKTLGRISGLPTNSNQGPLEHKTGVWY
jgi:hypothetical protein